MIELQLNLSISKFFSRSEDGSIFPISPLFCSELLSSHSDLKHMRIYKDSGSCFIYDKSQGIYVNISLDYLKTLIRKVLKETKSEKLYSYTYVIKVFNNLTISHLSFPGFPVFDKGYVVFSNGTLNLYSKTFTSHTPELFLNTKLPYIYDSSADCPKFKEFLLGICSGYIDRVEFLKSWLSVVLWQKVSLQVFFVLVGPAASGKSTLATVATALAGKEGTITTSLRSLHKDPFELSNLCGKKLILLSDSEKYQGDFQVIKQIVGCDSLQGRTKFVQGSHEVTPEGIITIVTNSPLSSRDQSGALTRRMRTFKTEKVFSERIPYLYYNDISWEGVLSKELPGIFNLIYNMDQDKVYNNIVHMEKTILSLKDTQLYHNRFINHLMHWVHEEIEEGQGVYIGYKPYKNYRNLLDETTRTNLYPAYISWCERKNIPFENHQRFSYELMEVLTQEGYECSLKRKNKGMFVQGIKLIDEVHDRDYLLGSSGKPSEVDENLYKRYMKLLEPSELKIKMNKEVKGSITEGIITSLMEKLTIKTQIKSKDFCEKMLEHMNRGKDVINTYGLVPFSYKSLGVSPRIIPTNYGKSINSVKRVLREYAYSYVSERCPDIEIIDIDLKSCYTSILLGLYPHYLGRLKSVIEEEGLWKHIEKEFERRGKMDYYSKESVKICTYSSFFQGGNKAMMDGILDKNRKDLGLTPKEFKESAYFEELHEKARGLVGEIQNSDIILTMRELSTQIKEEYIGKEMVGPTGHTYKVTEESFKTAYPNFLQSYEFKVISESVLGTINHHPEVELIGHYHDGVVLAIPKGQRQEILGSLQENLDKVRKEVKLTYRLEFELKS